MNITQKILRRIWSSLGSFHLSVALFFFMFLATWLGTLAQVELGLIEAQKVYFESWFYKQDLIEAGGRSLQIWLPGGLFLMIALTVNLLIGGIISMRRTWSRSGILIAHLGIVLLMLAGLVKFTASDDGSLVLYEGQQGSEYYSYYDWEIVVSEVVADGEVRQWIIPQSDFLDRTGERTATFNESGLPFAFTVSRFVPNGKPRPKGPMFTVDVPVVDGFYLEGAPKDPEAERNVAGCYVEVARPGVEPLQGILWGRDRAPMTVQVADRTFGLNLRKKRFPMPFTIRLDEFTHEFHPNTRMPRLFQSDITVLGDGEPTPVEIKMNEPLRRGGIIVFQSTWGPQDAMPGQQLYSGFTVVRNPSDHWPLWACLVILLGLSIQFGSRLIRYVRREMEAKA